jgi:hypothetical protein
MMRVLHVHFVFQLNDSLLSFDQLIEKAFAVLICHGLASLAWFLF